MKTEDINNLIDINTKEELKDLAKSMDTMTNNQKSPKVTLVNGVKKVL